MRPISKHISKKRMAKKNLSTKELEQLLGSFRSKRRVLLFELEQVRTAIVDLKKRKAAAEKGTTTSSGTSAKRGPGRPPKAGKAAAKKSKRGPGRPPKRVRQPQPLNGWDNAVLDAIRTSKRLLPKEDLLKRVSTWARTAEPKMKAADVEIHLTRTLQKLSGRKKMLGTYHSGLRRGYHYGLIDWFFKSTGKLRPQHLDKLVLTEA